ncbi:DNA-directed DNA polymerase [Coriobacterium glomerans PW2]|uniref:DNA polymerase IV n=1 Tax=Coriobacterium glomerans (strain ATCC 49209 / DSM 20642 / JCM 10262 / PW2) TaxID=700015 RepID=F2N7T8_CORGP|nr:DNA polymerase IV [Coriobacterium glomerans]AEB06980.1 DNA-directed DNA polymerase [Coriobacterium glomerans PW2]
MSEIEHTCAFPLDRGAGNNLFGCWLGPAIGLLDLDAFFASVEQLDHPEWRGRPLIVGGDPEERGVVSTASYEARRFGVHSAMSSAQARRLCPDAVWTHSHFDRYRELSGKVMDILADETPFVERVSIDEAFFDITPGRYSCESPLEIAERIRSRVSELGITCSIGLSTSKTVSKIASERDKPRGLTVILPGTEKAFLRPLSVRAMSGIGASAEAALKRAGIHTLGQIADASPAVLTSVFGCHAERMRLRAKGEERSPVSPVDASDEIKSVSCERTFATDLTERSDVDAALALLAESVGRRLRRHGLAGRTVTVKVKFSFGQGRTVQRKLPHRTDDENIFIPVGRALIDTFWGPGIHVRLLGVGISDFERAEGIQTDLFTEVDDRGAVASPRRDLSVAIDQVREKYGSDVVGYGRAARFDNGGQRRH